MENTIWNLVVPVPPVQLGNIAYTIMKYLETHENKFVPELNAVLLQYKKKTLRILDTCNPSNPFSHSTSACFVPVHPELFGFLNVRAQISVRVFSPRLGTQLAVKVSSVQPHIVFCAVDGAHNVIVTLNRCAETGFVKPASQSEEEVALSVGDVVNVRLSALSQNPDLFLLCAELVNVTRRAATVPNLCPDSDDDDEAKGVTIVKEVNSGKKKKEKKHRIINEPLLKQDEPNKVDSLSGTNADISVTYNKEYGSLMLTRKRCNSEHSTDSGVSPAIRTKTAPGNQQPPAKRKRSTLEEAHQGGANHVNDAVQYDSQSQGQELGCLDGIKPEEGEPSREISSKVKGRKSKEKTPVSAVEEMENLASPTGKQKVKNARAVKPEQT